MSVFFVEEINDWLDSEVISKVKISTYDSYKYRISKYVCPRFEKRKIEGITSDEIQDLVLNLEGARIKRKLSPSTVDGIFVILSRFFERCVEKGIIVDNPCLNIALPKRKRKRVIVLSMEERRAIVEELQKNVEPKACLVAVALLTGMRLGELCSLKWKNVDLRNKRIYVKNTKRRIYTEANKTKVITTSPKTEDSTRTIPITSFIVKQLRKLPSHGSEYVFSKNNGTGYDNRSIQKYFERLMKRLEIKDKNFHTLRHTFATSAVESNMDIKTLSMILGHSNVTTTMNLYVHPNEMHTRNAMEKLSTYIVD